MKLNRQTIIAIAVLIVVVVVATFALLVFPQFGRLGSLDLDIEAAEIEVSSAETLLARRQAAKDRSAFTEAQVLRLANELPESPELVSMINELQNLMNREGLELVSMTPSLPAEQAGYSSIDINLSLQGRWIEIVNLLQDIPSMTRQIRVVSFSSSRYVEQQSADETPVVEPEELVAVSMSIQVYTMAQTDGTTDAAAPAAPAP